MNAVLRYTDKSYRMEAGLQMDIPTSFLPVRGAKIAFDDVFVVFRVKSVRLACVTIQRDKIEANIQFILLDLKLDRKHDGKELNQVFGSLGIRGWHLRML